MSDIENAVENMNNMKNMYTLAQLVPWFIVCIIIAGAFGIGIGYFIFRKKKNDKHSNLLENFILMISAAITIVAIFCEVIGCLERFSGAVITVFSSIVFSWLLTKTSNKEEWRKQEEELAIRSYRHIDYIETASNTAKKMINQYIVGETEEELGAEEKLILSRAMDYIGYIQGGINTCKLDWLDLISDAKKSIYLHEDSTDLTGSSGQSVTVAMNQEDA